MNSLYGRFMLRKDKQTKVTLCDRETARKLMNRRDFRRIKPLISCEDVTPEQLHQVTPIEQDFDPDMVFEITSNRRCHYADVPLHLGLWILQVRYTLSKCSFVSAAEKYPGQELQHVFYFFYRNQSSIT